MRLAGDKGELVALFRAPDLRKAILAVLPDLQPELDEHAGVHELVATLERKVMNAVQMNDRARANSVLALLDAILDRPELDSEIPNAISISFVQPKELQATDLGRTLWKSMPERVRELILANGIDASGPRNERAAQQGDAPDEVRAGRGNRGPRR